jgi:hypothetical protein
MSRKSFKIFPYIIVPLVGLLSPLIWVFWISTPPTFSLSYLFTTMLSGESEGEAIVNEITLSPWALESRGGGSRGGLIYNYILSPVDNLNLKIKVSCGGDKYIAGEKIPVFFPGNNLQKMLPKSCRVKENLVEVGFAYLISVFFLPLVGIVMPIIAFRQSTKNQVVIEIPDELAQFRSEQFDEIIRTLTIMTIIGIGIIALFILIR